MKSISFIARNTRGVFVLEILFFTVSGLLPPLNVLAISLIIAGAEDLLGGMAFAQTTLLNGMILFGTSLFAQRMILLGQMPLTTVFQYRIKNQIDRLVVEKTVALPYANVEDSAFQTKLEAVRRFADGLPNLLFQALTVFQAVLALLLLVIQFQGQAWLILPLALGQVPGLSLSLRISQKQHDLNEQIRGSGRIGILISHRLGSTRFCDRILVLKDGRIVQDGSFDELIEQDGLYKTMYEAQSQWYQEAKG